MDRLRRWGWLAGIVLIVATNAIILAGIAYNRDGVPDSSLHLTQRELAPPYEWGMTKENSGLSLRIEDRVAPVPAGTAGEDAWYSRRRDADWLDDAKLAALGIDAKAMHERHGGNRGDAKRGGAPTAKEVLFVLEQDGPTHAAVLARARRIAVEEAATAAANAGNEKLARRAESAAESARMEERERSRLFVVDAGLDREALRVKYPDRQRYAIVRGILRPTEAPSGKPAASIERLSVGQVSVPYALRQPLAALIDAERTRGRPQARAPFEATVAWGHRLEPWMEDF